jgi:sirohydrochlorin cobaltochelatase
MHAILFVGHGTRNATGQQQFVRLAEHLRTAVAPLPLDVAYIELQSPTIEEALLRMRGEGIRKIILSPALLFAAGHAKQDIPEAVARAVQIAPDLEVSYAEPLGCHEAMLELAALRFQNSLAPVLWGEGRGEGPGLQMDPAFVWSTLPSITTSAMVRTADPTALVLIGRGSSDPAAIAHCQEFAAKLAARLKIERHFTGFIAIAKPSLPEVLELAAASGAKQIVVQPHLLFSGEMLDTTAAAVFQVGKLHPHIVWRQSDSLGSDLLNPNTAAAVFLVRALRNHLSGLFPL